MFKKLSLGKEKLKNWIKNCNTYLRKFTNLKLQLLLVIVTFLMVLCIYYQARIMRNSVLQQEKNLRIQESSVEVLQRGQESQLEEFNLSKRPYVYIEVKNVRIIARTEISQDTKATTHYMVQADIELKNEGTIPAIINNIAYYVTTDKDKRHLDIPSYFEENLGSYPYPTIIFPKQENLKFIYGADCSPATERIYFNVVVSYKGYKEDRQYWYSFISKYAAIDTQATKEIKLKDGASLETLITVFNIIPLQLEGKWDRDKNFVPPDVYVPQWDSEKREIEKQRIFLQ